MNLPKLLSVRDFCEKHKFISQDSLRRIIRQKDPEINKCIIKIGRKYFVDEEGFFEYLKTTNQ